jgi:prepilin-type processing-associated H-X9-DG protein
MYAVDNEGRYPMSSNSDGTGRRWADYIFTYVRDTELFSCPEAPASVRVQNWATSTGVTGAFGGYGYNYQYLGNSRLGPVAASDSDGFPFTATENEITTPSRTIALADTDGFRQNNGTTGGSYTIDPPQRRLNPDNSFKTAGRPSNDSGFYGSTSSCSGDGCRSLPVERHLDTVVVAFADGHAKAMKLAALDDINRDGVKDNGYFNGRGVADNY